MNLNRPVAHVLTADADSLPVIGILKTVERRMLHVLAEKYVCKQFRSCNGMFNDSFFLCSFSYWLIVVIQTVWTFVYITVNFFDVF